MLDVLVWSRIAQIYKADKMRWILFSVLANTTATIFLKLTATHSKTSILSATNRLLFYAGALMAYSLAFVTYKKTLNHFPVGISYASITSLTAILVGLIGAFAFGEALTMQKILGFVFICTGIFFLSISTSSS
jgi:multidrug transporter EmrE-like cation transporter